MANDEPLPEIVGFHITAYKNLRNVWLPWSDGVSLFGVNGAGKTNLLECLALLLGTEQTLTLAGLRPARPDDAGLSVVVRMGPETLPWPAETVAQWMAAEGMMEMDLRWLPPLARARDDWIWWQHLGVSTGDNFAAGLRATGLPEPLLALLADLTSRPLIRYTLMDLQDEPAAGLSPSPRPRRRYARTLVAPSVPEDVMSLVDDLPDVLAPLREAAAGTGSRLGPWVEVMELPPTPEPPAVLQWLPRSRSSAEVSEDLVTTFEHAAQPVHDLANVLGDLPLKAPPQPGDWHWWLHTLGERLANEELSLTLPDMIVAPVGGGDADWAVYDQRETPAREVSSTLGDDVLDYFSSGERRWIDEALATVARGLGKLGEQARWQSELLDRLPQDPLMNAVLAVAEEADASILKEDYWSEKTFDALLQVLEPIFLAAAVAEISQQDDPVQREALRFNRNMTGLRPRRVIRVFDEPEAHLHPRAQRAVARALDALRHRGSDVVIASHSPVFLDLPGWSLTHVRRGVTTSEVVPLTFESALVRDSLAADMGVNRGELLAGINQILIVEGLHDQLVLESLFGEQVREAGVAIVRMFGTENLLATADLDFIDRYLDVPIAVLLDYTKVDRISRTKHENLTDEEKKLSELRRACKSRGRTYQLVGLDRPDIVAYLSESAIRQQYPDFPGWKQVLQRFEKRTIRPPFKAWLNEQFNVDLSNRHQIKSTLDNMKSGGHQPVGELVRKVEGILASALSSESR